MQMLGYYCATGYKRLRVINGRGRGGQLSDLSAIPREEATRLKEDDVYLDADTGDFYGYDTVIRYKMCRQAGSGFRGATRDCIVSRAWPRRADAICRRRDCTGRRRASMKKACT